MTREQHLENPQLGREEPKENQSERDSLLDEYAQLLKEKEGRSGDPDLDQRLQETKQRLAFVNRVDEELNQAAGQKKESEANCLLDEYSRLLAEKEKKPDNPEIDNRLKEIEKKLAFANQVGRELAQADKAAIWTRAREEEGVEEARLETKARRAKGPLSPEANIKDLSDHLQQYTEKTEGPEKIIMEVKKILELRELIFKQTERLLDLYQVKLPEYLLKEAEENYNNNLDEVEEMIKGAGLGEIAKMDDLTSLTEEDLMYVDFIKLGGIKEKLTKMIDQINALIKDLQGRNL